jgi:two-component system sporulation sensor kinase B
VDIALEELGRTESIIRDFLTFAKPAPEKVEKINVEELINQSLELIVPLAQMNNIVVDRSLTSFWITGERVMLQQALLNILKNSIEAMPKGGVLSISTTSDEEKKVILIKDTGVGMDIEQLGRLGKPYFTTKGQKGTGLGLMVAYRVIEGLNGKITVDSETGKGTMFRIDLSSSILSSEKLVSSVPLKYIDN